MPQATPDYAEFVRAQVKSLTPGDSMRAHAAGWRNVLDDIYRAGKNPNAPGGLFEVTAIVVSRWEFLGGLYSGETEKTDVKHAAAYARRFLPKYNHTHNLSGQPNPSDDTCELFAMLRNKPLHGFTPAGVFANSRTGVVTWAIGASTTHLALVPAGIQVDCLTLAEDLCKSMEDFATVLDQNTEAMVVGSKTTLVADPRPPRDRWIRAFWARFCPIGFVDTSGGGMKGHEVWMKLGEGAYGIPA
jgi:hypothetical protein